MNILAFDTATPVTSVAVGVDGALVAEISITGDKVQMERLMPMIDAALKEAGLTVRDINGVAVGVGPGLFTALRIGVTTANTLSQVLRVPAVGVSSLDVLAAGVAYRGGVVAAAIDARRGEVFARLYRVEDGLAMPLDDQRVLDPQVLADELAALDENVTMVGDGFAAHCNTFKERLANRVTPASPEFMYPRASSLLQLAEPALNQAPRGEPALLAPQYIRQPDAVELIKKMRR
jgi:tRNA threonylcarbamoyladenosine biosynthesis protein TsaB